MSVSIKSRWYSSPWFLGVVFALAILAMNWEAFLVYWQSPFIQGWDGSGHAAIGEYYANHIYPKTWGWVPNWYAGLPFPQFYPPLLYFIAATLYFLLPLSYTTVFKILVTTLQLLVPLVLVFFVSKRVKSVWPTLVAGVFAVLLVSAYQSELARSGIGLVSTLRIGLIAQLLAFLFLVPWYHYFLQIETNVRARYFAGLFLFLLFLSNAHTTIVVFFLFLSVFLSSLYRANRRLRYESARARTKEYWRLFKLYFLSGLVPLAAASFWVIPLLVHYSYFVTDTVFKPPSIIWKGWLDILVIVVVSLLGVIVGFRRRKYELTLISLTTLVFFVLMQPATFAESLGIPVHANRWIAVIIFLSPLALGLLWQELEGFLLSSKQKRGVFLLACTFLFFSTGFHTSPDPGGLYTRYEADNFFNVLDGVTKSPRNGLLAVEMLGYDNIASFAMDAYLGERGVPVATSIFRESSISSYALTPLRNAFSIEPEVWGFKSFIGKDYSFIEKPIGESLDLAEHLGVGQFLIRSARLKEGLLADMRVEQLEDYGTWTLLSLKEKNTRAETLSRAPIAFIGPHKFKDRNVDDYDWTRFSEEFLFSGSNDLVMYYPRDQHLDSLSDSSFSGGLIVSSYTYRDFSKALGNLVGYSTKKPLVVVANKDPLFGELFRLSKQDSGFLKTHKIVFIDNLKAGIIHPNQLRAQMPKVLGILQGVAETSTIKASASFEGDDISVELPEQKSPLPVYIKGSYFPEWERNDGEPIFLASPGFMVTFATSSFKLDFRVPPSVYTGDFISVMTILITLSLFLYDKNRKLV